MERIVLLDILYLVGTVAFFVLMQVYVAKCDQLRRTDENDAPDAQR